MDKRVRERVALVVFLLLAFGIAVLLLGYFSTGRTWNVAASAVDDTVGRMEGYTAIVYGGVAEAVEADGTIEAEGPLQRAQEEEPTVADSLGLTVLSILPPLPGEGPRGAYASDVRNLYEQKQAQVVTLDLDDPSRYAEPAIVSSEGKRIGVLSLDAYATRARLDAVYEELAAQGVDALVCVTPRLAYLGATDVVDVVIVTEPDEELSTRGRDVGGAFVVLAPERAHVGMVILSQNNTPSAKVIEAL